MTNRPIIFVFGSNLAGRHGRGASLYASRYHGARYGVGEGRTGDSYAIPTKSYHLRTLSLEEIEKNVKTFLKYATEHPRDTFEVTRIGCGLAGYRDYQIAPMFKDAPPNCSLPADWRRFH